MTCTQCGGAIEAGVKFCPDCGVPVPTVKKQTVCAQCGAAFSSRFCPDCGTPAAADAQPPPEVIQLVTEPPQALAKTEAIPRDDDGTQYAAQTVERGTVGPAPVIVIRNETTLANVNNNTVANVSENTSANVNNNTMAAVNEAPAPGPNAGGPYAAPYPVVSQKSRLAALLWAVFTGIFGGHRYYAGKIGTGLLYTFTYGIIGMGWLVDIILISCGLFKDKHGLRITNWM